MAPPPATTDPPRRADEPDIPLVTARTVGDDRTVFTEDDNTDGWIATDITVVPLR
ncbi:hypothetical protein [Salarchaeum japonicum]|uniref:Uncharacterized protein n=1 Tax=Salarchaeum japonicum TaxID=555573 RepID=A0AAV3SZK5_9EURY|nr:hypothetical protein [Salarchaeum japonicum]